MRKVNLQFLKSRSKCHQLVKISASCGCKILQCTTFYSFDTVYGKYMKFLGKKYIAGFPSSTFDSFCAFYERFFKFKTRLNVLLHHSFNSNTIRNSNVPKKILRSWNSCKFHLINSGTFQTWLLISSYSN